MSGIRMKPKNIKAVYDSLVYETEKSTLLASDAYLENNSWERGGTNTFLYVTKNGRFFQQLQDSNEKKHKITPLTKSEAMTLYFELRVHEIEFEKAFPNVSLEDA